VEVVVDDELQENNRNAMIERKDSDNHTLLTFIFSYPPLPTQPMTAMTRDAIIASPENFDKIGK
jgi:hypothetical protein